MYTGLDVLLIVIFTVFATVFLTLIGFACVIANSTEEKESKAYWQGYTDGMKAGK